MSMDRVSPLSFRALARAAYPDLIRFASALVGDPYAGRDIAQETMTRLWREWDSGRRFAAPDQWLRRVASNLAVTHWRRVALERRHEPSMADHEAIAVDWPEPDPALWKAIRRLPERQRVVVVLRILEDRSHADIAEVIGCSQANARQLLRRGLTALKASLQDERAGVPR